MSKKKSGPQKNKPWALGKGTDKRSLGQQRVKGVILEGAQKESE